MGIPIIIVASRGQPVTLTSNGSGTPMTISTNNYGLPVTIVASGGLPVTGFTTGPDTTAPIITSGNTLTVAENSVLTHYLYANEPVTWAKVGGADAALFTLASGVLTLPAQDRETRTSAVVQVQATDLASNVSTIQTITVTITDIDEIAPTITSASSFSTPENAAYNHVLTANEAVTWSITGGADAAYFFLAGSTLTLGAQNYEDATSRVVNIRATDAAGNQANQTITATITDVEEGDTTQPVITSPNAFTTPEGVAWSTTLTANEPVTWVKQGGGDSALFTLNPTTGALSLPAQDYDIITSAVVQVRALDLASNPSAIQTITVTITAAGSAILTPVIDLPGLYDSGLSSTDNITNVTSPAFDVICMTAPLVGDIIDIARNGVVAASATLIASDIAGTTRLNLAQEPLTDGTYTFTARHKRGADVSAYSTGVAVTIDTTAPVLTSPIGAQNGSLPSQVDLSVTTNTGQGRIYWTIQDAAWSAPTVQQIIDHIGTNDGLWVIGGRYGSFDVSTSGTKTAIGDISVSGSFKVYYTHTDTAGNNATVAGSSAWTHTIAAFTANGVGGFDSSTTYLTNTGVTGIATGKQGLVSFWIKVLGGAGVTRSVFTLSTATAVKLWCNVTTTNIVLVTGRQADPAGADVLVLQTVAAGTPFTPPPTPWIHVAVWWDLATAGGGIYVNGVLNTSGSKTLTDQLIGYDRTTLNIGASQTAATRFNGSLSELYINLHETLDLSVPVNLSKFITSGGAPVRLGPTGALPTGSQPEFYLGDDNDYTSWGTNNGSKGNFTVPAGALTNVTGPP